MGNHVHILLKEGEENLTLVLKRIAGSYVYWYNWKYHRSGHLFQDRFKSEPVEEAHKIIKKYSRCESVSDFQSLPIAKRDKFLKVFKDKGISIRQISRLTGISYYVVQKI